MPKHEDLEAIVLAGIHFRNAYQDLLDSIKRMDTSLQSTLDTQTIRDWYNTSWAVFKLQAATSFPEVIHDSTLLATKQEHYRKFRSHNRNHREYMRRKRLAQGITPQQSKQDYTPPTPNFDIIPRSPSSVPPEPDYNEDPNAWFEWSKKYGPAI